MDVKTWKKEEKKTLDTVVRLCLRLDGPSVMSGTVDLRGNVHTHMDVRKCMFLPYHPNSSCYPLPHNLSM